jgi:2-polyprenyl-6-methoxyphenol hydroxylase-like FAD-dependent oxidoreductase
MASASGSEVQRVVIIGGGIGGLATTLALHSPSEHGSQDASHAYDILIVERDAPPPDIAPEAAFDTWERPGVPQFRHAHILLARIQTTLRDQHPALLQQLLDAGLYLSTVAEILPPDQYRGIQPEPGDQDLLHLWGRRATFEYVLRRYVGQLPGVRFMHGARVVGLVTEGNDRELALRGVEVLIGDADASKHRVLDADLVVDASGSRSKMPEWLEALGVSVQIEKHASGFIYACRHYRLANPAAAPPREEGGGNLDYLGYATFYAEHGHYALTFSCPEDEEELSELLKRPDGFEALCAQLPVLQQWTSQSVPTTKVLGAGRFENRWRSFGAPAKRKLLGLFAVGDSHLLTNPMYGRGCASAFVQAGVLADALRASRDPAERAQRYYSRSRELLQPYFELSVATDRMYRTRARRQRGIEPTAPEKLLDYAYEKVWMPATHHYPLMAREFLRSVQMREISSLRVRLAALWLLCAAWLQSAFRPLYTPRVPPPRAEFLRRIHARAPRSEARSPSAAPAHLVASVGPSDTE